VISIDILIFMTLNDLNNRNARPLYFRKWIRREWRKTSAQRHAQR